MEGRLWPTVEHYYQAAKFLDSELQERVRSCEKPGEAKRTAYRHPDALRADWDSVREETMLMALREKFRQHSAFRGLLLATGHATLVERSRRDSFWGSGADGSGENRLGLALMKVREEAAR